jgi:hypothetical protein
MRNIDETDVFRGRISHTPGETRLIGIEVDVRTSRNGWDGNDATPFTDFYD